MMQIRVVVNRMILHTITHNAVTEHNCTETVMI